MEISERNKRIITGAILLLVLFLAWWQGTYLLLAFCIIVCLAAQYEFFNLFFQKKEAKLSMAIGLTFGAIYLTGVFIGGAELGLNIFRASMLSLAMLCLLKISSPLPTDTLKQASVVLASVCYIPLALSPLLTISPIEQLFVILLAPVSDTAAYFVGVKYGKHKIFPKISPKKSFEGAAAGLLAAIIYATLFAILIGYEQVFNFSLAGLGLGIMAQMGDFFESTLKRTQGVKDSSNLLPGHGGVLDRIDSILFVVPSYAFISILFSLFVA